MKGKQSYQKLFISVVMLILVVCVVVVRFKQTHKQLPDIQTATVQKGTVLSSVSGTGVLEAITTVDVKSNVGGQVVEMAVDEGDMVKAGQLIAKIDPSDSVSTLNQANADYSSGTSKVDQAKQTLRMQRLQTSANIISAEQALESSKHKLQEAEQEAAVQPRLTSEAISQAQSTLESAEATLKQTKSALNPQMVSSVKSAYDTAKSSYDKAERNLTRQKALLEKGFVSMSTVDDADAAFSTAKADLESAKSKLDTVKDQSEQDLKNAEAKVRLARSGLETARANAVQDTLKQHELAAARAALRQSSASLAGIKAAATQDQIKNEDILQAQAALQKSKAAVENARTQVNYTTVTSPRAGVVVKKYAETGSIVTAGRQAMAGSGSGVTIVEIADVSRMRVVVNVDETDVSKIFLGQKVDVTVDACHNEAFFGKVIKIAPMAEVNSNVTTVPVTVELTQTDGRLKPVMNATCDFVVDRKTEVLNVPAEAISETDSGMEVTVLDHGQPVIRKVKVGLVGNDSSEIIDGLSVGETVVIKEEDTTQKKSSGGPGGPGGGGPGGPPM